MKLGTNISIEIQRKPTVRLEKKLLLIFLLLFSYFHTQVIPIEKSHSLKQDINPLSKESNQNSTAQSKQNDLKEEKELSYYQDPTTIRSSSDGSYNSLALKLGMIMIVFLVFFWVILHFIKKKNSDQGINPELFELIAEYSISVHKKIKIMRVINDYYLLSVSQDNISLINKIEDKESLDKLKIESGKVGDRKYFFSDFLNHYASSNKWQAFSITENLKKRLKKS